MMASLVAQLVKNPPAMQETPGWFLGQEVPWRRNSYPLQYSWASLVVQTVNESACNVGDLGSFLGWEDPLEEGMVTHSSILA